MKNIIEILENSIITVMMTNYFEYRLRVKSIARHVQHKQILLMVIPKGVLGASSFLERNQELRTIKGAAPTHNYGCGAGPIPSSPVFTTSGKPSTRLPLGELVEQVWTSHRSYMSKISEIFKKLQITTIMTRCCGV